MTARSRNDAWDSLKITTLFVGGVGGERRFVKANDGSLLDPHTRTNTTLSHTTGIPKPRPTFGPCAIAARLEKI